MRYRSAAAASLAAVVAAGTFAPALAGPTPKPITKEYTATAPTPDPTPVAGDICDPAVPTAKHEEKFTVPAAGTLKVTMAAELDWALALLDAKGKRLADSDGGLPTDVESMQVKFKRKTDVVIRSCNFAGGPTAAMKLVFTYAPVKK